MNAAGCSAQSHSGECHSGECRGAVLLRPTQVLGMGLFGVPPPAPVTTATLPSNLNISEKKNFVEKNSEISTLKNDEKI
jgi:hypothetical protein